jgi:DNA-binding response OmpR family regulator
MKILICEDDVMTQKAIEHKLNAENYDVEIASNGEEALKVIEEKNIDLLITDLHMPKVDGLELINYIRNEKKKDIPIIMLTRVGVEETVLKAFELGADDYITKPFSPSELILRVKKVLMKVSK